MNRHLSTLLFPALALCLAASAPLPARAMQHVSPVAATGTINTNAELDRLKAAYETLAKADHDYKGHRVLAMHAIEKACDLLGSDIRGHAHDHPPQPISDQDLREARRKVEEVRKAAEQAGQTEVATHLDHAVKELDIALTTK